MSRRLRCCLLVIFLPIALCLDFQERSTYHGGTQAGAAAIRTWEIGRGVGERSGVEELRASPRHQVRERSIAGDGDRERDACKALRGYEAVIANNTHSVSAHRLRYCVFCTGIGWLCNLIVCTGMPSSKFLHGNLTSDRHEGNLIK